MDDVELIRFPRCGDTLPRTRPSAPLYTGRNFERFRGGDAGSSENQITPADVLALAFLSIKDGLPSLAVDVLGLHATEISALVSENSGRPRHVRGELGPLRPPTLPLPPVAAPMPLRRAPPVGVAATKLLAASHPVCVQARNCC
jgi:hypothetical protein